MTPWTRLAVVLLALALAGCVPAPLGTYYKPTYDGAPVRYSGNMCHGGAGAPAGMEVDLGDGVTLAVNAANAQGATRSAQGPLTVNLTLDLPERANVRFAGDALTIAADGRERTVAAGPLQVSASKRIAAEALFDPKRDSPTPELFSAQPQRVIDYRASAFVTYAFPDFRPARIHVELPGLHLSDGARSRELPPLVLDATAVTLARSAGAGPTVYRTQQASAAVSQRHEQCLRDAQRAPAQCRLILDFDEDGFDLERDGVRYTGRWYVFDAKAPFRGELTIEQKTPTAWRLASGEVWVRDAAGASANRLRIERVTVYLRYAAPFASAFTGVGNDPVSAPTRLSVSVPLPPAGSGGEPAQRYVLRLPDIFIDGKLVPLRPIEFERRRFDVGVLPFNC